MATAYAALVSLMNVLYRIKHPTCSASFDKSQIQSLSEKVCLLVDFLEGPYLQRMIKDLLTKMAHIAYATEDLIESCVADRILARSAIMEAETETVASSASNAHKDHALLSQDLEKEIQKMDLIIQTAMEVTAELGERDQPLRSSVPVVSSMPPSETVKMVGLDKELMCLLEELTADRRSRQIIPVVGMGGIGKTTLARNVYDHPYVKNHFHIQGWVTASQDYTVGTIIHDLLRDTHIGEGGHISAHDLGEKLYKGLSGRRYLIILDDIWSDAAWDEIRMFFPDNNNGSRILLTTRLLSVAHRVGSCSPHEVMLLDDTASWALLSQTIFASEVCPPELEKFGKKIAKSCKGLPLALVVIGGLLKMSSRTRACWEGFTENVSSIVNSGNDGHCSEILSLSYNQLPIHLKPCFLFIAAAFREDTEIDVAELMKLWVANGFLKPSEDRVLEQVAWEYLNDLISRNLVIVKDRWNVWGEERFIIVHDLLREFCSREAQNENFLRLVNEDFGILPQRLESQCRHSVNHRPGYASYLRTGCMQSSFSFFINDHSSEVSNYRVLQVFRKGNDDDTNFNIDTKLVHLRYLGCSLESLDILRYPIFSFWNLETLIIQTWSDDKKLELPAEFWELHNLRHLVVPFGMKAVLPKPRAAQVDCVLDNLQTLNGGVAIFKYEGDEVLDRIPNLEELDTSYNKDEEWSLAENITSLARLHKLEKLTVAFGYPRSMEVLSYLNEKIAARSCGLEINPVFPCSLRDLILEPRYIRWDQMTALGSLPFLQVLRLFGSVFDDDDDDEWNMNEGEFQSLKFLFIGECKLRIWRVESCHHLPRLERLELVGLELEEIPSAIGDLPLLRHIELSTEVKSAVISAKEIMEERENQMGYVDDDLTIQVSYLGYLDDDDDEEELNKLSTDNFFIYVP